MLEEADDNDAEDGGGATCSDAADVCLTIDGGDLNYTSTSDIYGFQFDHDGCATGASGGDATSSGFIVRECNNRSRFLILRRFCTCWIKVICFRVDCASLSNLIFSGVGILHLWLK